jgi:hypothetical protein
MPRSESPSASIARLHATATRLGITVLDGAGGFGPWPGGDTAAIVSFGEHIALGPDLDDDGLRADVLAMSLIVAAVMGDRDAGHPCAITAPAGYVLISRTRGPALAPGPGELATLLACACGRDIISAAFRYFAPDERDDRWEAWMPQRQRLSWAPASRVNSSSSLS